MTIQLENIGRRFNKEWIFRNVDTTFQHEKCYGIIGGNGSGKSTFVQLISGFLIPSEGKIIYESENTIIPSENIFKQLSFASPFLELYDEYTAEELFAFQSSLKPMKKGIDKKSFIELLELSNIKNKALKNYSSGMRQRVKLALAILADTPLLLLDEPCTNLDRNAKEWYKNLLREHSGKRLIFVSSNSDDDEMFLCDEIMNIENYKRKIS
ncbi:MAG: ABC transporter ATP-binding protein [Flavobacteriales bacterium]|nr:ABC transporter ATP-binding protein [Flavobacteriales bacterium]